MNDVQSEFNNSREQVEKEIEKVLANPDEHTNEKLSHLYGVLAELGNLEDGFNDGKSVEYDH